MLRNLAVAGVLVLATHAGAQPLSHVRVQTQDPRGTAALLQALGLDVLARTPQTVDLIVTDEQQEALAARGLNVAVVARGRPLRAPGDGPGGYPTLQEVEDALAAAAAAFPAICRFVDLTAAYGVPATHEGRHIVAVKISDNVGQDEDEPASLIVTEHHAREIVTPVIALEALKRLTEGYSVDPRITAIVDGQEVWIAPLWNPDGYEYVFNVNNLWRKNRRDNGNGTFGVDLNRNYPFGWTSPCAGSNNTASDTYRGPAAASEPETKTMLALSQDRRFAKVADLHSSGREVRYGYGCWNHPWVSFLQAEAAALASHVPQYVDAPSCCTGGDIHMHMATTGAAAFLWETHTSFQPPFASAQAEAEAVWPSLQALLERAIPLSGHVTDALTGEPLAASITLVGVNFSNGEVNGSGARFGRYHVFPPPGAYTVRFGAPGFVTQDKVASVPMSGGVVVNAALARSCYADCNLDGTLNLADFGCFQTKFATGSGYADCNGDGTLNLADFGCFQTRFALGCP